MRRSAEVRQSRRSRRWIVVAIDLFGGLLTQVPSVNAAGSPPCPAGVTVGQSPRAETIQRYVLSNRNEMRVGILTLGGIIDEIRVRDRRGKFDNVVLTLRDIPAYLSTSNFGGIVGRYANRISHGGFEIDGVRYPLSNDPNAIVSHGGRGNFSTKVWSAAVFCGKRSQGVSLRYLSPDGENGFPGNLDVTVTYTLNDDDELTLAYAATTDKPTVVNLTNHSYFNLSGSRAGSIDQHVIQINANSFLQIDQTQNATGTVLPVYGPLDLRHGAPIGARISADDQQLRSANGFNLNYVLQETGRDPMSVAARVSDPISGRTLEVRTTEPGLQFYTANEFNGRLLAAGDRVLRQGAGFALETQHYPDSPNQPAFPATVLRPGSRFSSTTVFAFGLEE